MKAPRKSMRSSCSCPEWITRTQKQKNKKTEST
jgi:hypothetical protein